MSVTAVPEKLLDVLQQGAATKHLQECSTGLQHYEADASGHVARRFSGIDFITHSVEEASYAGPEACWLREPTSIHVTREAVLTNEEIEAVIAEAGAALGAGARANFTYAERQNLDEVHTAELPRTRAWLASRLADTFFPLLAERYGLDPAGLRVFDSLVIRYDAARDAVRLPVHRDTSLLSLNIALSAPGVEYDGGGTYFEALRRGGTREDATLSLDRGHAMCHPSGLRHGGHRIVRGTRWVLVVFVLAEHINHAPRRISELAMDFAARGDVQTALPIFHAALEMAPDDHELHYGLASLQTIAGLKAAARASLLAAVSHYSLCPKPHVALGTLLREQGRYRAAVRRFERALALVPDESDEDAWAAAFNAGVCTLHLAHRRRSAQPSSPTVAAPGAALAAALWELDRSEAWLDHALEAAPTADDRSTVESWLVSARDARVRWADALAKIERAALVSQ